MILCWFTCFVRVANRKLSSQFYKSNENKNNSMFPICTKHVNQQINGCPFLLHSGNYGVVSYFLSCRKIQTQLHKYIFWSHLDSARSLNMNKIASRARAMQKLTINYCLVFFFHIRIFFDIFIMYQTNAELAWKYAQIRQNSIQLKAGRKKLKF